MNFIKTNIDTANKKEVYRLTKGDSTKIEGLEKGLSIPVDKYALYEEGDKKVLTFISGNQKYGTISATFIKSFMEILDIMEDEEFAVVITGGQSKNGRNYVNCELDCN